MDNNDQNELPLPGGKKNTRTVAQHLPRYFRTQANNKFLSSTLDQLVQPGVAEKVDGYFGRTTAPGYKPSDFYIGDVSDQRRNYQLEPAAVVKDDIDNVVFYGDYNDYINQLSNFGSSVTDHSVLNNQEYYDWDPCIDWDKFVNFREYYWLPDGPQAIGISGEKLAQTSTYSVTSENNGDNMAFVLSPDGLTRNPELTLYRGSVYEFNVDSPGLPISFRSNKTTAAKWRVGTSYSVGETVLYEGRIYTCNAQHRSSNDFSLDAENWSLDTSFNLENEVSQQSVEQGTVELVLTPETPDFIYYTSDADINAGGLIRVYDKEEASFIDVEKSILGKENFITGEGISLSNGMKIEFKGITVPEVYSQGAWYVEGVGTEITLISENDLGASSRFSEDEQIDFDTEGFDTQPFSLARGYPREKDYLTINRSSQDGNLWSRYNRWFHREVIEQSAEANGTEKLIDQNARAARPIIEFEGGIKLYDFGTKAKQSVDLVDDFTVDVFSTIEGSDGYNIDDVPLAENMRILFTADNDIRVKGRIFQVRYVTFKQNRQLALVETQDSEPLENETVFVTRGEKFRGSTFYYTGSEWRKAQAKTSVNQTPLFDVFDCNGISLADTEVYESSNFVGTPLFSYAVGFGPSDTELGFALKYRSIQNSGDIVFDFNLVQDSVTYCKRDEEPVTDRLGFGFVRKYTGLTDFKYKNGWKKAHKNSFQAVVSQIVFEGGNPLFPIDVYDNSGSLTDLVIKVIVDNQRLLPDLDYETGTNSRGQRVVRIPNLQTGSVVQLKTRSSAAKNNNGFYEIASNLERNPLNADIQEVTLGEINDHVRSIVDEIEDFEGNYPGSSNLRDQGNLSKFGRRIVKHSSPLNLSLYHMLDEKANLVKAIKFARQEYAKFKRSFVQTAVDLKFNGDLREHFEAVMQELVGDKPNTDPFYFSDMIASGGKKTRDLTVYSRGQKYFALEKEFGLSELSSKSVLVYLNGEQLVHSRDYEFNSEGFVVLNTDVESGDVITIDEYETTNGSFMPATPTKLGLYPRFVPQKFTDDRYVEPREVIQGHDGSIVQAFGDFRDDLLLELEKRVYNNIKIDYDTDLFDILDYVPGPNRSTGITRTQIDNTMLSDFVQWTNFVDADYTENASYNSANPFTWNYIGSVDNIGNPVSGNWRSIYQRAYDTDRPHSHPWEMQAFSEKPEWWDTVYGSAPYTSNNLLMWEDIEQGIVRDADNQGVRYSHLERPGLLSHLPVDEHGALLSPLQSNFIAEYDIQQASTDWAYGDWSPVESAWRHSAEYPFALVCSLFLNQPCRVMSTGFDRSRQQRGLAGDIVYEYANNQIQLDKLEFPNSVNDSQSVYTSGLVNYIRDYVSSSVEAEYAEYKQNLRSLNNQIGAKIGGFTTKNKWKLILDSRTPLNEGNVFVPEESYQLFLNTSAPTRTVYYSGVAVEKQPTGFLVRGYNTEQPYFVYNKPRTQNRDSVITVGGIEETVITWDSGKTLTKGSVVEYQSAVYRVDVNHVTGSNFEADKFVKLPRVPTQGGVKASIRSAFSAKETIVSYGTLFTNVQDLVDFLLGYGNWLERQGLAFDYYDPDSGIIANWQNAVREYMFWTSQNWSAGSVVALSPGAFGITVRTDREVVDDVYDTVYGYSVLGVDGEKLDPENVSLTRQRSGEFQIHPRNTDEGIYGIRLAFVQKEQVLLLDNKTQFNDIIYDQPAGYRQERIRVLGYRTDDWDGSANAAGFILDEVEIDEWQQWRDYDVGDIVKHKEFYYSAVQAISGASEFDPKNWSRLTEKPTSQLIPNLEYKTNQFADFYDLDTDNFDAEQQKFAQHLIGYQNRDYLANIINDPVSQYKFYQGYIKQKGTPNALTSLFDALASDDKDSLEFYEEWAIKSAQYGATDAFKEVEYILDEAEFRISPQPIRLDARENKLNDLVYDLSADDVYLKPKDYDNSPFPSVDVKDTFTTTAGYVNPQDVDFKLDYYADIADLDIFEIRLGSKIWLGESGQTWDIVTAVSSSLFVRSISNSEQGVRLVMSTTDWDIQENEVVGVYNVSGLDGVYRVTDVSNNEITIDAPDADVDDQDNLEGKIIQFVSARFNDAQSANKNANLIDRGLNTLWLDDADNNWKVLENTNTYTRFGTSYVDNVAENSFGYAIAANSANTVLAVGDPYTENGKVHVFTRATENAPFVKTQTLEIPQDIADPGAEFGSSVAVSSTGDLIAVGSPQASRVRTPYRGEFDEAENYAASTIVSYQDTYWKSVKDIQARADSIIFGSFESVPQVLASAESRLNIIPEFGVLFTGDFPFSEKTTDHFVVRAPADMYAGTAPGDQIRLVWNTLSYSHATDSRTQPLQGTVSELDAGFVTQTHVITDKIDNILYVDASTNVPDVGQIVETQSAFATVAYRYNDGAKVTVYVKDQNGDFGTQGSLTTSIGEFVGEYETQAVLEYSDSDSDWQGFWKINTGFDYEVGSVTEDRGLGLVYADVIPQGDTDQDRIWSNVLDYNTDAFSSYDTRNSEITSLTYEGTPGPQGESGVFEENLYVMRAPKPVTDRVIPGNEIDVFYNVTDREDLDPSIIGVDLSEINRRHNIYDVWDGYIDFDITKNLGGTPIEPKVGITVRDVTNEGTAKVVFYQKFDTVSARIYVKDVSGTWALGNIFGENREIEFLADGSGDDVYDPEIGSRVFGQIQSRSLGYADADIGSMLVFQTKGSVNIPLSDTSRILDAEYWFYLEEDVEGIERPASVPSDDNNDWRQTFRIPASSQGTPSTYSNEGMFTVYSKQGTYTWSKIDDFIVPDRRNNASLGKEVKISQTDELTRLFVSSKTDQTDSGKVFVIKNGLENGVEYTWELGRNKSYKGFFLSSRSYTKGDLVYKDDTIQKAVTNIPAGAYDDNDWTDIEKVVDYTGSVPNSVDTGVSDFNSITEFAVDFDVSDNGEVLITSSSVENVGNKILVYRNSQGLYVLSQEISIPNASERFAESITISANGRTIVAGDPLDSRNGTQQGVAYIWQQQNGTFVNTQTLVSAKSDRNQQFGHRVDFGAGVLAISTKNGDSVETSTFDSGQTVFDRGFTEFRDYRNDVGTIQLFEIIQGSALYSETLDINDYQTRNFGEIIHLNTNHVYSALPGYSTENDNGLIVEFRASKNARLWNVLREPKPTVDVDKIKKVSLYDRNTNTLVENLDFVDPLQGKVAGLAEQELSFKTYYDPAVYTQGNDVLVDATQSWGSPYTGKLWWDISNSRYLNPHHGEIIYSANNWNTLFSDAYSVDVYEWIESDLKPSEWDKLSGTARGIARGITGTSRYGDDAFSVERKYDKSTQVITRKYYYWVKNKNTVPAGTNRRISAQDVANLIADPQAQNYRFISFISPSEIALYNCESLVKDRDIVLNVQYFTIDDQSINVHNQYDIVSEGLSNSRPSARIEQKWFDSLVGFDSLRNPVPDSGLSERQKYGILDDPRQSWFVNRTEALKQIVERVNTVLESTPIAETKDLNRLFEYERPPLATTGVFDVTVETEIDLDFVGVAKARPAVLEPVIENGELIKVFITDTGRGYIQAPAVSVQGKGLGASVETIIDSKGQVIDAVVTNRGQYYGPETVLVARKFAVLVENDSTIGGRWSVYEKETAENKWTRIDSQGYDVAQYWTYRDWYSAGYNAFSNINHVIAASYELQMLDDKPGDIIKIENVGQGGWLLLQKTNDAEAADYSLGYKTVGSENATILILDTLYDPSRSLVGYAQASYDTQDYDSLPSRETRIILETLRDSIFTGELAVEYNKLFFASLRYVFSEQKYVDWAFKTSFIKAQHNVGELAQKTSYQNDNLGSYESYVQEVKPYSTNIREYLSAYEKLENSRSLTTDFDLPPRYFSGTGTIGTLPITVDANGLKGAQETIVDYPDQNWLDNAGMSIEKVNVANSGGPYTSAPVVRIEGGQGQGAKAVCSIGARGEITEITVTNQGSGYLEAPSVIINGSLADNGEPARASAVLSTPVVRSQKVGIKFDRVSGDFEFEDLSVTENFVGTGNKTQFELKWPMDLKSTSVMISVNQAEALGGLYSYKNIQDNTQSYTRHKGLIEFNDAPEKDAEITVEYRKSIDILTSADRISADYDNDRDFAEPILSQLMEGVDYGGVEVTSFGFSTSSGWDAQPYTANSWDVFDQSYEDEVFTLDQSTVVFELNNPLDTNVEYNVYRIAYSSNGTMLTNTRLNDTNATPNAEDIVNSQYKDGTTTEIDLSNLGIQPASGNESTVIVIIRKETSAGSLIPDPESYDTNIIGGDLAYSSARGIAAEEITVDGDGFVTETRARGPEEIVPGQVLDTLDIQVYETPSDGASNITVRNYTGDGTSTVFSIGERPLLAENVFVVLDNTIVDSSDYQIDVSAATVTLATAPGLNSRLSIISLGVSGTDIIGVHDFTASGSQKRFVTEEVYTSELGALVTVSGVVAEHTIENNNSKAEIVLENAASLSQVVKVIVLRDSSSQTYSTVNKTEFIATDSQDSFELSDDILGNQPALAYTLVTVNDKILAGAYSETFTVNNTRRYQLDSQQVGVGNITTNDIEVYVNNTKLTLFEEWSFIGVGVFEQSNTQESNIVVLEPGVANIGDELVVYVLNDAEYRFGYYDNGIFVPTRGEDSTKPELYLEQSVNAGDKVTVYGFSNHNSQKIQRQKFTVPDSIVIDQSRNFGNLRLGTLPLISAAHSVTQVWVFQNGDFLVSGVDFTVTPDGSCVQLVNEPTQGDVLEVVHFSATIVKESVAWRQFTDMLNRTHYKKISEPHALASDLRYDDKQIDLVEADSMPEPAPDGRSPGVIWIDKERIEYFVKDGNSLTQLRRGTLGTGIKSVYTAGTEVFNQASEYNLPYTDKERTDKFDDTRERTEYQLSFDVDSADEIEVFKAGKRLNSNSISVFVGTAQDSPEGDETKSPDYFVDNNTVVLAEAPLENSEIVVVKKIGYSWSKPGEALSSSESDIAKFLRAV